MTIPTCRTRGLCWILEGSGYGLIAQREELYDGRLWLRKVVQLMATRKQREKEVEKNIAFQVIPLRLTSYDQATSSSTFSFELISGLLHR